jgi:uracil-DNA glycosylase family 4
MMNQPSHIVEEMGLGPLWVRRNLPAQAVPEPVHASHNDAAAPAMQAAQPSAAPAPASVPASSSVVTPVSAAPAVRTPAPVHKPAAVVSAPSFDMDGPPSWLDEMDGAVSVSPGFMPHADDDDEYVVPRVDVSGMDWPALKETVAACKQCNLCDGRKNTVFGVGDQKAKWLFVGEGPGRNEDIQGEPFVGKAGQLLDNMLVALNMKRGENVYIANIVKCRPTDESGKDRRPSQEEVSACLPYLKRQIELVQPTVVVALGHTAAWALLGIDPAVSVGKLRGTVHRYNNLPVIVTYHPSYLLRQPQDKAQAWKDLCLASTAYQGTVQ